jgi:hypothetical protein
MLVFWWATAMAAAAPWLGSGDCDALAGIVAGLPSARPPEPAVAGATEPPVGLQPWASEGDRIAFATNGTVRLADLSVPRSPRWLGSVAAPGADLVGLAGARAVAVAPIANAPGWERGGTRVWILDVSEPDHPRVDRTLDVEGSRLAAALAGDELVLLQQVPVPYAGAVVEAPQPPSSQQLEPAVPAEPDPTPPSAPPLDAERVAAVLRGGWVGLRELDASGEVVASGNLVTCESAWSPAGGSRGDGYAAVRIALSTGERSATGVFAQPGRGELVEDGLVVVAYAPDAVVHHLVWTAGGRLAWRASGSFQGWPEGFDVEDGQLRAAWTEWEIVGSGGQNQHQELVGGGVTVFDDDGRGALVARSLADGFSRARPSAVAFAGDRAWIATDAEGAPAHALHLVDLSGPSLVETAPAPAFASAILPDPAGNVVVIGRAEADGGTGGVRVARFDAAGLVRLGDASQFDRSAGRQEAILRGDRLAVAAGPRGVLLFDVDPKVALVGRIATPTPSRPIAWAGEDLVLLGSAGLVIADRRGRLRAELPF